MAIQSQSQEWIWVLKTHWVPHQMVLLGDLLKVLVALTLGPLPPRKLLGFPWFLHTFLHKCKCRCKVWISQVPQESRKCLPLTMKITLLYDDPMREETHQKWRRMIDLEVSTVLRTLAVSRKSLSVPFVILKLSRMTSIAITWCYMLPRTKIPHPHLTLLSHPPHIWPHLPFLSHNTPYKSGPPWPSMLRPKLQPQLLLLLPFWNSALQILPAQNQVQSPPHPQTTSN